jgi:hypothetical protein
VQGFRTRRDWLRLAGGTAALGYVAAAVAAPAAPRAGAAASSLAELKSTFDATVAALNSGKIDEFYAVLHPNLLMIDEDSPWRLDLAGFKDHIGFHGGNLWESFAWKPNEARVRVIGATGVVVGAATFRGKPKDAGYRLRPLLFSQGWVREASGWRMLLWHQSPIVGHVSKGSPG